MSYGLEQRAIFRRAAAYADEILQGAEPSSSPLSSRPALLARADRHPVSDTALPKRAANNARTASDRHLGHHGRQKSRSRRSKQRRCERMLGRVGSRHPNATWGMLVEARLTAGDGRRQSAVERRALTRTRKFGSARDAQAAGVDSWRIARWLVCGASIEIDRLGHRSVREDRRRPRRSRRWHRDAPGAARNHAARRSRS